MWKRRNLLALAVCALVALSLVAGGVYLAFEAAHPHDCAGEDCPVCRVIDGIARLRRCLEALPLLAATACLVLSARGARRAGMASPAFCTLVVRKTRMND